MGEFSLGDSTPEGYCMISVAYVFDVFPFDTVMNNLHFLGTLPSYASAVSLIKRTPKISDCSVSSKSKPSPTILKIIFSGATTRSKPIYSIVSTPKYSKRYFERTTFRPKIKISGCVKFWEPSVHNKMYITLLFFTSCQCREHSSHQTQNQQFSFHDYHRI